MERTLLVTPNFIIFLQYVEDIRKHFVKGDTLRLDLNQIKFVKSQYWAVIACLIEDCYLKNDGSVQFNFSNARVGVKKYIENLRIQEYWEDGLDRNNHTKSKISTLLALWKINQTMIDQYSNFAADYFNSNYPDKSLDPLSLSLKEIFNNIFDHSFSNVDGYVITQRFPQKELIETSVCDFGMGIAQNVMDHFSDANQISSSEALKLALKLKFTTESKPHNRGFGLANIHDQVKNGCGTLKILCNDVLLKTSEDPAVMDVVNLNSNFRGTIIHITLNESKLPEKEDVIHDSFHF